MIYYIFLSDTKKREILKNEFDKHIKFDNNNKVKKYRENIEKKRKKKRRKK